MVGGSGGVVMWWCGGVVVCWCGGVVVWWCGGVAVCWSGGLVLCCRGFESDSSGGVLQVCRFGRFSSSTDADEVDGYFSFGLLTFSYDNSPFDS